MKRPRLRKLSLAQGHWASIWQNRYIKTEVCVIPGSKLWIITWHIMGLKFCSVQLCISHQENSVIKFSVSASTSPSPDRYLSIDWRGVTPSYVGIHLTWLKDGPTELERPCLLPTYNTLGLCQYMDPQYHFCGGGHSCPNGHHTFHQSSCVSDTTILSIKNLFSHLS